MELSAIFKTLIKSDAEDWHRVSMQTGRELACWRGDVNLRIETSIDDAHVQNDNFFAEWANKNPDQSAKGWFYAHWSTGSCWYLSMVPGHRCHCLAAERWTCRN
jgi:hypothetical protein